jgi:glycosyltransferase involved in cell wall biosynthesis
MSVSDSNQKPLEILQLTNSYSLKTGGAERIAFFLHQNYVAQGKKAYMIGLEANGLQADPVQQAENIREKGVYSLSLIFRLLKKIRQKQHKNLVIHAHMFPTIFYLAVFKFFGLVQGKLVMTEHSTSNRRRNKAWGKVLDAFIYKQYSKIFAISKGVALSIEKRNLSKVAEISIIPNGSPMLFENVLLREVSIEPIILSIGSLRTAKNYNKALQALALIKHLPWQYQIAGEGPDRPHLEKLILDLKLGDRVALLGRVDPPKALLEKANLFFMPSLYEGFGLAALEAMNASLPMVVSDVEGLADLIKDSKGVGRFAELCDPNSQQDMAQKLQKVLSNQGSYLKATGLGFQFSQDFTDARMAQNYLKHYPLD